MEILEITKQQQQKIDQINKLLTELRRANVYPYVIDGGGGAGLSFIRHTRGTEVGEVLLGPYTAEYQEIYDKMYTAVGSSSNPIDCLCP